MRKGIIYVYFNKTKYEKEGIEKYYVGQTMKTIEQRAGKDGRGYGAFNETCNNKFANGIRKWGWNSFEGRVLEEVYEEDLDELEKFYIEYFDSFKNGYNSTLGGEGTRGHNPYADKTEEEMEEIKEKIRNSNKKHFQNPKARENRSETVKKRFQDPKEREKASIAAKNRYKNPKEREKQSIISKAYWKNPEIKEKILGELNPRAKKVYCKELNIIFSYAKLAEKYCINILNSKTSGIGLTCNGKTKYSGKLADGKKLTWNWIENIDKETLDNAEYIDSKKYEEIINERKKCGIPCELNPNEKNVYCNELNIIFSYVELAKKYCKNILNIKIGRIRYTCDGKTKYSGKLADGTKLTWNWTKNLDKEILNNAEYIDRKKYEEIISAKNK